MVYVTRACVFVKVLVWGRPFIMYALGDERWRVKTSYAFHISVILQKCVEGEGGGQVHP